MRIPTTMLREGRGPLGVVALAAALSGCDFTVTNPGPIPDEALEVPAAGKAVLVGLVADVEVSADAFAYWGGVASTDLTPDATRPWVQAPGEGRMVPEDAGYVWNPGQRARWVAEQGIERLKRTQENADRNPLVAAAYIWAGYANRLLGDNVCVAVFDSGPAEPNAKYYERAVSHFTVGLQMAERIGPSMDSLRLAALAGLAQSHLILGNYDQAAGFAARVPDNFVWLAHRSGNSEREYNEIWQETHQQKQVTVAGTYSDTLGARGDPRTPWVDTRERGASGTRAFYRQMKYADRGADIALAKGAEMRLIEAEATLRRGDVAGAVARINAVRSAAGVQPVTATTPAQAWLALDRERHLVLWLEGRRLKDNQRFAKERLSAWSTGFMQGRNECFPPSLDEINSNPNLESWRS